MVINFKNIVKLALMVFFLPLMGISKNEKATKLLLSVNNALPIKNVVLYSDRASVSRNGIINLHKGLNHLVLKNLSPVLLDDSLTLDWKSDSVKLLSIFTYKENTKQVQNRKLKSLETSKDLIVKKIKTNNDKIVINNLSLTYISKFRTFSKEAISENTTSLTTGLENLNSTIIFLINKENRLKENIRILKEHNIELEEKKYVLVKKINKIKSPLLKKIRITEALLWSNENTQIKLNLKYIVFHCSWKPHYAVRINKNKVKIEYYGKIKQQTGENWNNVNLTLSTAKPNKGLKRPLSYATRMYSYKSKTKSFTVGIIKKKEVKEIFTEDITESDTKINEKVNKLSNSVVFKIASSLNIPSGNKKRRILITIINTYAKRNLELYPSLKTQVYSRILTKNNSSYPILAGKIDLFKNAIYSGFGNMNFVSPNSKFKITTGIFRKVQVKRKEIPHKVDSNLLGSTKTYHKTYKIVIQNLDKETKEIEVFENIPVSLVENYKVKLSKEITSKFSKWNKKTGIIKWKVKLKAKHKKTIVLDYKITVPSSYKGNF